jgi:hypothetical protein
VIQSTASNAIVPPGHQGLPHQPSSDIEHPTTDISGIVQAASQVDQKQAAPIDTPPNVDAPPTSVTAIDGTITDANTTVADVSSSNSTRRRNVDPSPARHRRGTFGNRSFQPHVGKRAPKSGFEKVFDGLAAGVHDASIQGTAFLTYTVVSNATYNVQACTDWCATVKGCGTCPSPPSSSLRFSFRFFLRKTSGFEFYLC